MNTSGDRLFPGCPVEDVEGYVGEISNAIPTVAGEETNLWVQTSFQLMKTDNLSVYCHVVFIREKHGPK